MKKSMRALTDGLTRVGALAVPSSGPRDTCSRRLETTGDMAQSCGLLISGNFILLFGSSTYYFVVDFSPLSILSSL